MNNYSAFNDPQMYLVMFANTAELSGSAVPVFAIRPGEQIVSVGRYIDFSTVDEIRDMLDAIDIAIIEEIARSKFLTFLQIYEFITLRGHLIDKNSLHKRLHKLLKYRAIRQEALHHPDDPRNLTYYRLEFKGNCLAREQGVPFTKGNRYLSYHKRAELGLIDTPLDVRRILAANQIVIGLLLSNAQMDRFGIMETYRPTSEPVITDDCIMRTTANVKIDPTSILAYEVVRDCPESYEKLADKVRRYYKLLRNKDYLVHNHHDDIAFPQLIICGESLEHNQKIVEFLKSLDLWGAEDTILFTEDRLNMANSLQSIYQFSEDGRLIWYRLPERKYQPKAAG